MNYYEGAARHSEHDYAEYISKINFTRKAREDIEQKKLYNGVKNFLIDNYEDEISGGRTRRKIKQKAKKVVNPRLNGPYNFPTKFKGKAGSELLVKESIEQGYIKDIKLNVPWHPAIYFDKNKLTTFPHQHSSAVLYRSIKYYQLQKKEYLKKINYVSEVDPVDDVDELYNAESIFKKGFIEPALFHDDVDSKDEEGIGLTERFAIYFTATHYWDKDIVFEAEIPTNLLGFNTSPSITWSTEGWFNKFEKPKRINSKDNIPVRGMKQVIFAKKKDEKGTPHLPLKFINGIDDFELSNGTSHFYPLEKYVKAKYKREPEKYPKPSKCNLQRMDRNSLAHTFRRSEKGSEIKFDKKNIGSESLDRKIMLLKKVKNKKLDITCRKTLKIANLIKNSNGVQDLNKYLIEDWDVLDDYNKSLAYSKNSDYGFCGIEIGDFDAYNLRELIENNYFKKTAKRGKKYQEQYNRDIKKIHESLEGKNSSDHKKLFNENLRRFQNFFDNIYYVKLNQKTVETILDLYGVPEYQREEHRNEFKKTFSD